MNIVKQNQPLALPCPAWYTAEPSSAFEQALDDLSDAELVGRLDAIKRAQRFFLGLPLDCVRPTVDYYSGDEHAAAERVRAAIEWQVIWRFREGVRKKQQAAEVAAMRRKFSKKGSFLDRRAA